jgi:hypothetical protein
LPDRPKLLDYAVGDDGTVMLWISYGVLAKFQLDDKKRAEVTEFDTLDCPASTDPDMSLLTGE